MSYITRAQAEMYRKFIVQAANSLTDEEAAYVPRLFKYWQQEYPYEVGDRVQYVGKVYKVLQAHKSQVGWEPDIAVSLFAEILIPDPTVIPEWVQPSSTNPYMLGDKVRHNGKIWASIYDYNVWEPGVYGWEEVTK